MVDRVVGIDPGLDGGLVCLDRSGAVLGHLRMPKIAQRKADGGTRNLIDVVAIADFLRKWKPAEVIIEDVFSSSQMGVVGAFSFGEGKGALRAICGTLDIPVRWVSPVVWKGRMGVLPQRGRNSKADHRKALKAASIQKAQVLFPGVIAFKHDGLAEAALMGAFGLLVRP